VKTKQEEMEPPGHKAYRFGLAVGGIASQNQRPEMIVRETAA